jgi:hypothetical protein
MPKGALLRWLPESYDRLLWHKLRQIDQSDQAFLLGVLRQARGKRKRRAIKGKEGGR